MPDRVIKGCPYCLESAIVKTVGEIIDETTNAYLVKLFDPDVPGTYAIIPKMHIADYLSMPGDWQYDVNRLLEAIPGIYRWESFEIITSIGEGAGQTEPHICVLIVPRMREPDGSESKDESATKLISRAIQAADERDCGVGRPA